MSAAHLLNGVTCTASTTLTPAPHRRHLRRLETRLSAFREGHTGPLVTSVTAWQILLHDVPNQSDRLRDHVEPANVAHACALRDLEALLGDQVLGFDALIHLDRIMVESVDPVGALRTALRELKDSTYPLHSLVSVRATPRTAPRWTAGRWRRLLLEVDLGFCPVRGSPSLMTADWDAIRLEFSRRTFSFRRVLVDAMGGAHGEGASNRL